LIADLFDFISVAISLFIVFKYRCFSLMFENEHANQQAKSFIDVADFQNG